MNGNALQFDSFLPVWVVVGAAVLLGSFFIWREAERKLGYRTLRIIAQVIIVISLASLILRPSIKIEKPIGSVIVLTKGYSKKTADSLVSKHGLRVIRAWDADPFKNSEEITSWHALSADAEDIRFVLGEGISSAALDEHDLHFTYFEGDTPYGITQLNIPDFKKNQLNFIKGEVNTNEPAILKIIGPGGLEDSVQLEGTGHEAFSLALFAKQEGRFVYQLILEARGKVIETEDLPVEVLPERKLNILFLQPYPTFEVRNLKNFLGGKGHAVTVRYEASRNVFQYEYSNRDKQVFTTLTRQLLNEYDVLITTPEAMNNLSPAEFQILQKSITEGLGILLFISQPLKSTEAIFPHALISANSDTVSLLSSQWKGKLTLQATALRMKTSPGITGLFTDKNNDPVSGYFYKGSGKIGFQFLNETYALLLAGKSGEYASIWSPLIESVARRDQKNFEIVITAPFPRFIDQPIDFEIVASHDAPELYYDRIRIALKEDVSINELWHGTIWADTPGWHQFTLQDSTIFNFYVSEDGVWNTLWQANQYQENKLYFTKDDAIRNPARSVYEPVSPLLFFILFVIASGSLWLMAKI